MFNNKNNNRLLFSLLILNLYIISSLCVKNYTRKDPCSDYPSCKLISEQMFENYCNRTTLKNMCPSHCDKKCKNSTVELSIKSIELTSTEEEELEDLETTITSTTTTTTTTKKPTKPTKKSKTSKMLKSKSAHKSTSATSTKTTTTTTTTTTTVTTTKVEIPVESSVESSEQIELTTDSTTTTKSSKISKKPSVLTTSTTAKSTTNELSQEVEIDEEDEEDKTSSAETTSTKSSKKSKTSKKLLAPTTTTSKKLLLTEKDNSESTKTVSNLPNATIYVPLYEAGFVQRVIPTSNKPECDFTRALVCKKEANCIKNAVWCPMTNDVPKEQIEILFNYTTDIYMFETQGRIDTNETITNFLFQYLNEAGILVSHMYRTETTNSSTINKYMFEPPLRTNYIRLTPIDFVKSIALRFEVYSKGVLYNPEKI